LTNDGILLLNFVWPKIKKAMSTNDDITWTDMERDMVSIKKGDDEWTEGPEILQFVGKKSVWRVLDSFVNNTHVYQFQEYLFPSVFHLY
jgi:hypothetical protein